MKIGGNASAQPKRGAKALLTALLSGQRFFRLRGRHHNRRPRTDLPDRAERLSIKLKRRPRLRTVRRFISPSPNSNANALTLLPTRQAEGVDAVSKQ